jgi:hypothetical protein
MSISASLRALASTQDSTPLVGLPFLGLSLDILRLTVPRITNELGPEGEVTKDLALWTLQRLSTAAELAVRGDTGSAAILIHSALTSVQYQIYFKADPDELRRYMAESSPKFQEMRDVLNGFPWIRDMRFLFSSALPHPTRENSTTSDFAFRNEYEDGAQGLVFAARRIAYEQVVLLKVRFPQLFEHGKIPEAYEKISAYAASHMIEDWSST